MNSYIFIICPPYSGSTILWKLVSTSDSVSALPNEGQFLPEVKEIMRKDPWNDDLDLPWEKIKQVWNGYWDQNKPLLFEKSPPHLIRTNEIEAHFSPAYFLIMVRNPYAHCEGLIRLNKWDPIKASEFSIHCMRQQAKNVDTLTNSIHFTYEELVEYPEVVSQRIQTFIPQIGRLRYNKKFNVRSIDGNIEREIVDLNKKKINNLSFRNLNLINKVLRQNTDVMEYWGYEYYQPPRLGHTLSHLVTRGNLLLSKGFYKGKRLTNKIESAMKSISNLIS